MQNVTEYGYTRPPLEDWEIERARMLHKIAKQMSAEMGEVVRPEEVEQSLEQAAKEPFPMNRADRRAAERAARRAR